MRLNLPRLLHALVIGGCAVLAAPLPAKVELVQQPDGAWQLRREGKPYVILGAGGVDHLELLAKLGGNSIRTWGIKQLEETDASGKNLLDRAHALGLTVSPGIWVQQPRHGFNLDDPKQVEKQRVAVREAIRRYKDHPAILVWGLGNEVEIQRKPEEYPRIFRELNELARIVKAEDPDHPVMTILAGASEPKIRAVMENYPEIDILGINSYGSSAGVPEKLRATGWTKPYIQTEYGPKGPWECEKTDWDAAIEPPPGEKAESYRKAYEANAVGFRSQCLGTYAFKWGTKQEVTSTWFGLFLDTGEKTPSVDAIARCWTGQWPENRSPMITKVEADFVNQTVAPGSARPLTIRADDAEGDVLASEAWVMAEAAKPLIGGDKEAVPARIDGCFTASAPLAYTFRAPGQPGNYRAFVKVSDGRGGACTQSLAFRVE